MARAGHQRNTRQNSSVKERPTRDRKARNGTTVKEGYGKIVSLLNMTFKPMNDRQRLMAASIRANVCTFASGPAGTGKSFTALAIGCEMLKGGLIDTIVCLKPDCQIDAELGTLPGNKDEKLVVLYNPMRQILIKLLGKSHFENLMSSEKIIFEPLGSVLGMTYDNALMIIDESQYTTPGQMKALLTRLGRQAKVVICGDYKEQRFIDGMSGMEDAYRRLRNKHGVGVIEYEVSDIVRSDFTRDVILAYREEGSDDF